MLAMSQPVTRLYEKKRPATDAVAELKKNGFPGEAITLVTPADAKAFKADATASDDSLFAALEKAGISKAAAAIYAERILGGASVVSITPNWGTAQRATKILNSFGPAEVALPDEAPSVPSFSAADGQFFDWTGPAPLSEFFKWDVLQDNPTPLSSKFNWPVLSKKTFFVLHGSRVSELSNSPAVFSSWLKWPLLSNKTTPLSDWLKIPVLSDKATPFSDWAKWPLLSNKATPFSDYLNAPVLR
jgi:hypothetical protein